MDLPIDCRAVCPSDLVCLSPAQDHVRVSNNLISDLEVTLLDKLSGLFYIFNPLVHGEDHWEPSSAEGAHSYLAACLETVLLGHQTQIVEFGR